MWMNRLEEFRVVTRVVKASNVHKEVTKKVVTLIFQMADAKKSFQE